MHSKLHEIYSNRTGDALDRVGKLIVLPVLNPMARVNTVCISSQPRASYITVGMHQVQHPTETKRRVKLWPVNRRKRECIVSSGNTVQVLRKEIQNVFCVVSLKVLSSEFQEGSILG
jgi:hypothetical protein